MKEKEVNLTSSQKIENKLNSFIGKHAKLIVAIFVAIVVVVIAVAVALTVIQSSTEEKFDALVDFAFNLGCDALEDSTLLKKIRACRPDAEIRAEFMRWVFSGKKKLPGLVTRRQWEADRYFNLV